MRIYCVSQIFIKRENQNKPKWNLLTKKTIESVHKTRLFELQTLFISASAAGDDNVVL